MEGLPQKQLAKRLWTIRSIRRLAWRATLSPPGRITDNRPLLTAISPALLCMAMVFLITGASLATLPLHIRGELGFGGNVVGILAGAQFIVAVVSRI